MNENKLKRNYLFSDGALCKLGDILIIYALRDLDKLITYGYDEARLEIIKEKIAEFKDFPADGYLNGHKMLATSDKKLAMAAMTKAANGVVQRAAAKFRENPEVVRSFCWKGYATKKASDKFSICRTVHKQGTKRLDELASEGLTDLLLNDLKDKIEAAVNAYTAKSMKVSERGIGKNERIKMGNSLYDELVKLAGTGKLVHADENESLYNDYVIYRAKPRRKKKPAKKRKTKGKKKAPVS